MILLAINLDAFDLSFDWNGDYDIGNNGDIKDTSRDGLDSLIHQLHDICASLPGDWELYPNRGAGLDDFLGEPNNKVTSILIQDRLKLAIVSANLIPENDLKIRTIPIHKNKLLIILSVNAIATSKNSLVRGQSLYVAFVYDTIEKEVFFLEQKSSSLSEV